MIKSFSQIRKKIKDIKLIIIGSGEDEQELLRIIEKNKIQDNVIIKKYQNNIFNYLDKAIFFVLTSEWEDPGFVIIEAAICIN